MPSNNNESSMGYPRPLLVRAEHTSLDGAWQFATDPSCEGLRDRWFEPEGFGALNRTIVVPFPPESEASGIHEDVSSPLWYQRQFQHTQRGDDRVLLHFEGVDYFSSVWVNGMHVGDHEGSQSRFTFDISEAIHEGNNDLVVRAVDDRDLEQPRGKQDWQSEPHAIWYRRTSGIWRSVWIEQVPAVRIDTFTLTPGADLTTVHLESRIAGEVAAGTRLEMEISREGRLLSSASFEFVSSVVQGQVRLVHPGAGVEPERLWWTPESPVLLDVSARLVRDSAVLDSVSSYLGLRTISTDASNVLVNGRKYFLRLVLEQAYWPHSHLASPSLADLQREAELIKELGFNGLRMHQTSADPRFLEICDRIGLLVFADTAAAYEFSTVSLTRTVSEMTGLIRRDIGHPSVVGWLPFNESWGLPNLPTDASQRHAVRALTSLVKALDPSRIVIGNDGWEFVAGDLVGVHDYTQKGEVLRDRYGTLESARRTVESVRPGNRVVVLPGSEDEAACVPIILSEFGGISVHDAQDAWAGYGEVLTPDQLTQRLSEMAAGIGVSSGLAGYCYTQLTDTEQEMNGLLTATREYKCPPEKIRAAFHSP